MIFDIVISYLIKRHEDKKKKELQKVREPKDTTWDEDW